MSSRLGSAKDVLGTSLLSIPPEIRVQIFQRLFSGAILQLWHDVHDGRRAYMDRHAIAVTSTCRQLNTEALPILLENLELMFEWFPGRNALAQIHLDIKKLILPHIRHLTFARSDLKLTIPIEEFRSVATCLKVVDLGSTTISLRLAIPQMYDATVNKLLAWPSQSSHRASPVWSFNRYLMTVTLSCCLTAGDSGHYGTSPWLRPLLADQSRRFSLIGRVCGACIDEQGRYLEIVCISLANNPLRT